MTLPSCSTQTPKPFIKSAPQLVYQGEYIVDAKGDWCPWSNGVRECTAIFSAGSYSVSETGTVKLIKPELSVRGQGIVEYDPEQDLCLTDSTLSSTNCSPNFVITVDEETNDPQYTHLWGLHGKWGANANKAWDIVKKTPVRVAVIDTGVECEHEELKCVGQFNAITGGEQNDGNGHGTHVAGTICATGNNKRGVVGMSWSCDLLAVKFLSDSGSGSTFDAIKGIDWAVQNGAQIINASWGGGGFSKPLEDAIKRAEAAGVLFVAAAGNRGLDNDIHPHYPSSYDVNNILSVAAIDKKGEPATFTNYGKQSVDIAAPGVGIISTYPGGYQSLSGTSMAAPHVAGQAALLTHKHPGIPVDILKRAILETGKPVVSMANRSVTGDTIDAFRAISESTPHPTPTPAPTPKPCQKVRFDRCIELCKKDYVCAFKRQKACRGQCRRDWGCKLS